MKINTPDKFVWVDASGTCENCGTSIVLDNSDKVFPADSDTVGLPHWEVKCPNCNDYIICWHKKVPSWEIGTVVPYRIPEIN